MGNTNSSRQFVDFNLTPKERNVVLTALTDLADTLKRSHQPETAIALRIANALISRLEGKL